MLAFLTAVTPVLRGAPTRALSPRLRLPQAAPRAPPIRRCAPLCSAASPGPLADEIAAAVSGSPIFIASKASCPYSAQALSLLHDIGADSAVTVWDLNSMDNGFDVQDALQAMTGQRTVPNIFIGGKHVGGCSELMALDAAGELEALITSARAA